jgi:TrmH family RNA methyltransferase
MEKITSLQNPKIKDAVQLRDRKTREKTDRYLIEGTRELTRAIQSKHVIETIFFCPDFFVDDEREMIAQLMAKCGANTIECSKEVFAKLSYRDSPDGLLGVAPQVHRTFSELDALLAKKTTPPFLVIAESIEKPGNLGTILRSCDAAGVDAVIICDPTTDIHNPNVVRSSVGTLFSQFILEASTVETMHFLKTRGISIVAATPHAKIGYTEADFTGPLAISVGTEQIGLTEAWMQEANIQVRIPMFGMADSLNVASATTLVLYEVIRQRRKA